MAHLAVVLTAADATAARDLPASEGSPSVDHVTLTSASLAIVADRSRDVMSTERILALPVGRSREIGVNEHEGGAPRAPS